MMIKLNEGLRERIQKEGEGAYPNECCGFLLGRIEDDGGRIAEAIIPIENAREEAEQYHRFRIEPEDFMRAEKEARKQHWDVLGFYHSHPDHQAAPSEYDREHALPFYSYVIVSITGTGGKTGRAGDMKSWELSPGRREFFEEEMLCR
ncbi:MAG: M67 family metallopeptidase [Treponema sp.]|jgi:proteasome lid subunit RPN8/RPN11|nr:M67 family metallopeptidase [Treponema sp.]